jgi:hypothetical protein
VGLHGDPRILSEGRAKAIGPIKPVLTVPVASPTRVVQSSGRHPPLLPTEHRFARERMFDGVWVRCVDKTQRSETCWVGKTRKKRGRAPTNSEARAASLTLMTDKRLRRWGVFNGAMSAMWEGRRGAPMVRQSGNFRCVSQHKCQQNTTTKHNMWVVGGELGEGTRGGLPRSLWSQTDEREATVAWLRAGWSGGRH